MAKKGKTKKLTINDKERSQELSNNEFMFNIWEREGGSRRNFIKKHRSVIDQFIKRERV